jgi:hypothetical protein
MESVYSQLVWGLWLAFTPISACKLLTGRPINLLSSEPQTSFDVCLRGLIGGLRGTVYLLLSLCGEDGVEEPRSFGAVVFSRPVSRYHTTVRRNRPVRVGLQGGPLGGRRQLPRESALFFCEACLHVSAKRNDSPSYHTQLPYGREGNAGAAASDGTREVGA